MEILHTAHFIGNLLGIPSFDDDLLKIKEYRNIRKEIFNSFEEKKEKFTYNGNPLGFDYINEFADALKNRNTYLFEKFEKKILENPSIVDIKNLTNLLGVQCLLLLTK